jgi:hypothetical protein
MRPTAIAESALRAPLNQIIGRESHVRLLRVLALRDDPIRSADLARLTGLDPAGVRRALDALVQTGIVEIVGTGRARQVQLRSAHPLAGAVRTLYAEERQRADTVIDAVSDIVAALTPAPRAAWLMDPLARTPDDLLEPIGVGILTTSKDAAHTLESLERELATLAGFDVTFDAHVWTTADLATITPRETALLQHVQPILGPPPLTFTEQATARAPRAASSASTLSHDDLDERSLALASAVASKLARDPDLVRQARTALAKRLADASRREKPTLREWELLLRTVPPAKLRHVLVDRGPRATRLRQSLPFVDVLTPAEREAVLAAVPSPHKATRP